VGDKISFLEGGVYFAFVFIFLLFFSNLDFIWDLGR
jgi:hypothetical protein